MSRKSETFFDAITHLREDLIEEAQNYKFRKKAAVWKKFGGLAACIVLIMSVGVLAILPRGCGSSGGGAGSNSSAAPTATPQEDPASSDTAPPLYGIDLSGGPEESESASDGSAPSGAAESRQFTAIVIEVRDEGLLVVPIEYDSCHQCLIPFADLELPALAEGDRIKVTCAGSPVFTSDPPVISGVRSVEKIDPVE